MTFPNLRQEQILEYECDYELAKQLRWLDEPPEQNTGFALPKFIVSEIPQCMKQHFNVSSFLIGTFLIAASSIFLGRFFTVTETIQEELPTYQEKVFVYDVPTKENFGVPTALSFCKEKQKSDDIYMEVNVQKCLNKIEKRMKRQKEDKFLKEKLKYWEKYLINKAKYLTEKQWNLKKRERQFVSNQKVVGTTTSENMYYPKKSKAKSNTKDDVNDVYHWKNEDNNKHSKYYNTQNNILEDDNFEDKLVKSDNQIVATGKTINKKVNNDYKENMKKCQGNCYKNLHKKDDEKSSYKKKNYKEYKHKMNPLDRELKYKIGMKDYDQCNKKHQKYRNNYIKVDKKNDTRNSNWLTKLFKGRSELRNKEKSGDWYFDRSFYRKRKRDKAKWYFDWMMDREILRYKRFYLDF